MKISMTRQNDYHHWLATNETGAVLHLDGSPSIGGENKGFSPMESLVASLGGCSAIDMVSILKKQRQIIEDFEIELTADKIKVAEHTEFKSIALHLILTGDIDEKKVQKALQLTKEKYCSVYFILSASTTITYTYEIK